MNGDRYKTKFLAIVFTTALFACVNPPKYPPQPKIVLLSVSDSVIDQRAIINVTFSFQDGDGDLGTKDAEGACPDTSLCKPKESPTSCYNNNNFSIFVTDERTGCLILSGMILPEIPPKGNSNAISGEITTNVGPICCLPPDNTAGCIPNFTYTKDTLLGTIQIKDRAGNFSNKISFGPVIIDCTK
jgi:hypothetical protein